jgi:hypothetical protein
MPEKAGAENYGCGDGDPCRTSSSAGPSVSPNKNCKRAPEQDFAKAGVPALTAMPNELEARQGSVASIHGHAKTM